MRNDMTEKLPMGKLILTPAAIALSKQGIQIHALVERHLTGDWGDVDDDDRIENERAVAESDQVWSCYNTDYGRIWIVTQADRTETAVMVPGDY